MVAAVVLHAAVVVEVDVGEVYKSSQHDLRIDSRLIKDVASNKQVKAKSPCKFVRSRNRRVPRI